MFFIYEGTHNIRLQIYGFSPPVDENNYYLGYNIITKF